MWYSSCIPPMSGTGHLLAAFPSTRKHTQLYLKKSFHSSIQQSSQTLPIPCKKKKSHQDLLTIFAVWNAQENKQDMWHNFLINHPGTVVNWVRNLALSPPPPFSAVHGVLESIVEAYLLLDNEERYLTWLRCSSFRMDQVPKGKQGRDGRWRDRSHLWQHFSWPADVQMPQWWSHIGTT